MLELPEVEVLRRDLEKEMLGKRIKDTNVRIPSIVTPFHRTRPDFTKLMAGRKVAGVRRRGMVLLVDLDEDLTWVIDPGAAGSVHREATGRAGPSVSWVVTFVGGGALHGSDGREGQTRMGVVATPTAIEAAGLAAKGLDPLEDQMTWPDFLEVLRKDPAPMKTVLTDQRRILGLGDVYADEVLFEAGLRFDRMSDTLSSQEVRRLYRGVQEVIHAAIKHRTTNPDDRSGDDEDDETVGHLRVWGREGLPCPRCRHVIVKTKAKKRGVSSFHCAQCQI